MKRLLQCGLHQGSIEHNVKSHFQFNLVIVIILKIERKRVIIYEAGRKLLRPLSFLECRGVGEMGNKQGRLEIGDKTDLGTETGF